jgi:FlaA1/EpsC-like NDP-sugar epimerase
LGSNGSVIPLFKKQIESGSPISVTHKDITRFFMTIPEACQSVLEAGIMGRVSKNLLCCYQDDSPFRLKIPGRYRHKNSGLRPGEKLYEELLANDENTLPTYHEKIMIAKVAELNTEQIKQQIERICCASNQVSNLELVSHIKKLVPEYISNNSVYEKLNKN